MILQVLLNQRLFLPCYVPYPHHPAVFRANKYIVNEKINDSVKPVFRELQKQAEQFRGTLRRGYQFQQIKAVTHSIKATSALYVSYMLSHIILTITPKGTIYIPILHIGKLRHGEAK